MVTDKSESSGRQKVGIFGGTFNPIHFGHLRAAEEVRQGLALDLVVLLPSARPPHKGAAGVAAAADRLEMVRRARRGNPQLVCSAFECLQPGASYTVQALDFFGRYFPPEDLFFILGWDAWNEIDSWYDFRKHMRKTV